MSESASSFALVSRPNYQAFSILPSRVADAEMSAVVRIDPLHRDLLTQALGERIDPWHTYSLATIQETLPHSRVPLDADIPCAPHAAFIFKPGALIGASNHASCSVLLGRQRCAFVRVAAVQTHRLYVGTLPGPAPLGLDFRPAKRALLSR